MVYYLFAHKFGFTPEEVDRMDGVLVEEFSVLIAKTNEKSGGMSKRELQEAFGV